MIPYWVCASVSRCDSMWELAYFQLIDAFENQQSDNTPSGQRSSSWLFGAIILFFTPMKHKKPQQRGRTDIRGRCRSIDIIWRRTMLPFYCTPPQQQCDNVPFLPWGMRPHCRLSLPWGTPSSSIPGPTSYPRNVIFGMAFVREES